MQKKQKKLSKISNGALPGASSAPPPLADDPFGDNDDDVARVAREMEAKYVRIISKTIKLLLNFLFAGSWQLIQ